VNRYVACLLLMCSVVGFAQAPAQSANPPDFRPDDPKVISTVQALLSVLGYGHIPLGPMNAETSKELKNYQLQKHLSPTGVIDLATYQALLSDYEHPPTFVQIRDAGKLPKWANTVCFTERSANDKGGMEDVPEQSDPNTASSFFVYGPKGDLGIQTEEYLAGRTNGYAHWDRQPSSTNVVRFISVILPEKKREAQYMNLTIDWSRDAAFTIELRLTSTNEPIRHEEGHCQHIGQP